MGKKERFAFYLTPEKKAILERRFQEDGSRSKTLSTILGHVSSATTLNTYSHVTDEMRQRAAVKIDQGIAKVEVNPQEEKPKERTMTTFQARKRWSRKAS